MDPNFDNGIVIKGKKNAEETRLENIIKEINKYKIPTSILVMGDIKGDPRVLFFT